MSNWLPNKLPEDIESERALLATLCSPGADVAAQTIAPELSPEDFTHPKHQAILAGLKGVLERRFEVNPLTLKVVLEEQGALGIVGGFPGLMESLNAEEVGRPQTLVEILRTKRKLRTLIRMGAHMVSQAVEETDPEAIIETACSSLAEMGQAQGETGPVDVGDVTDGVMAQLMDEASGKSSFGVRTGFYRFDGITRGLKPGELIILAARPGVGKSTLALNWALRAAARRAVALFSLEMSKEELTRKLLTDQAGMDLRKFDPRDQDHLRRLGQAKHELDALPITIDDRSEINIRQIRAKVERLQARGKAELVIVDYLQLMTSVDKNSKQNETHRLAEISRGLKLMAKDCRVPVIVLSQLNREVEKRANGKPQLSDLRDSGAIEQDADMVVFIHRKIFPGLSPELQDRTGELHIAKHRNGPCGSVPLKWDGALSRYEEEQRETGVILEPAYAHGYQREIDLDEEAI